MATHIVSIDNKDKGRYHINEIKDLKIYYRLQSTEEEYGTIFCHFSVEIKLEKNGRVLDEILVEKHKVGSLSEIDCNNITISFIKELERMPYPVMFYQLPEILSKMVGY